MRLPILLAAFLLASILPAAAQTCTYMVSPTSQSYDSTGGFGNINVITTPACSWTATTTSAGLGILFPVGSVTGSGGVQYLVSMNAGQDRTGTITVAGQTVTITQTGQSTLVIPLTIIPPALPAAQVGVVYIAQVAAAGGTPPYSWSSSGTLPPGLSLNANGAFTGTPTTAGTYTFSVTVKDAILTTVTGTLTITVTGGSGGSTFAITTSSFPSGTVSQAYQQALTTSGACSSALNMLPTFSLTSGNLPAGLTLQNTGIQYTIAGTPTAPGTFSFTLQATDFCSNKAGGTFSIVIAGTSSNNMAVSPGSLTFRAQTGNSTAPGSQSLALTSTGASLAYNATATTSSGGNWLSITPSSGSTPGALTVNVTNFAQLAANTYNGSITIASNASNSPSVIPVTLVVSASAALTVTPPSLAFTLQSTGTTTAQKSISVGSTGASLHFTTQATTSNGTSWLTLSAASGDTPATLTATVSSAGLAPNVYNGSIILTSATSTQPVTIPVTLTVTSSPVLSVSSSSIAFTSAPGAQPSTQNLSVGSNPAGVTVSASATTSSGGNWLAVTPTTGATALQLAVSANPAGLAAGTYSGTVTITPSDRTIAPMTVAVSLTVGQQAITIASVTNAASFAPGPVSPGEFVTLFGTGLGPATPASLQLTPAGTIATSIGGTSVLFDGVAASMVYASPNQVNAIVPYKVATQSVTTVQVQFNGALSNAVTVQVAGSAPAIFTIDTTGQGAILNQDGSTNGLQGGAQPGDVVSLFGTGEGQTTPPGIDGSVTGATLPMPNATVSVTIGGLPADVQYAGAAPGLAAGVLQVNVRVPPGVPRLSRQPVMLTVGSQTSPPVFLTVN